MRLIIAGSRNICVTNQFIDGCLSQFHIIPTEIVSGGATGIDRCGEISAKKAGCPIKRFEADWDKYGKTAGPIRNEAMAQYAQALLLIWDGTSPGSANMKKQMIAVGKPVFEIILPKVNKEV